MSARAARGAAALVLGFALAAVPSAAVAGQDQGLTYLVPDLEGAGWRVSDGPRRFAHAVAVSPAMGKLGDEDLFALRLAYNPNAWLGYEASLGHNAASSLHALIHTFNVQLRRPVPWRLQPYLTVGYGMMTVYPGAAVNADPVTKNTVTYGGGLEIYVRDDIALRGEIRAATVFGQERDREGTVAYTYREYTLGFVFYRSLASSAH
ncbi:MAG: outer membrane beta-barrel protein [Krumholzibacteria bacterium]|nr:outer membrane beta-barrel protein [Candidatus Krumholzibacteria bacterium]